MLFSAVSVDCENSLWTFSGSSGADFFCSILSRVVSSVKYAIIIVSLKKKFSENGSLSVGTVPHSFHTLF